MNTLPQITRPFSRLIAVAGLGALALSAGSAAHATSVAYYPTPSCFAGAWSTNYGPMVLKQSGSYVCGPYSTYGCVGGYVSGNTFRGEWCDGTYRGYCEFTKTSDGCGYTGYWKYPNGSYGGAWSGRLCQPTFQASWCTTYGPMRLFVDSYGNCSGEFVNQGTTGRISGKLTGNVMLGTWAIGNSRGTCKFVLAPEGTYFVGAYGDVYGNYQGDWCGDYTGAIYP